MSKNATGVDQTRGDDGQLAHQATPKAVGHEADNLVSGAYHDGYRDGKLAAQRDTTKAIIAELQKLTEGEHRNSSVRNWVINDRIRELQGDCNE